jgi:hypothetical protein
MDVAVGGIGVSVGGMGVGVGGMGVAVRGIGVPYVPHALGKSATTVTRITSGIFPLFIFFILFMGIY